MGMIRRKFLQSVGALGALDVVSRVPHGVTAEPVAEAQDSRDQWVAMARKLADPMLTALSEDRLKETMPVETRTAGLTVSRTKFSHLEGFGRLLSGLAPWIALPPDTSDEGRLREKYFARTQKSLANAVDPNAKDFMNFDDGSQPLVDASFLALGLLRAPRIWNEAEDKTKRDVVEAFRRTRTIKPGFNNWLLFSAMIEAFFLKIGEQYDRMRIDYALRQHDQWYKGDGIFGDGPDFHWDFYNSFVIQPYMRTILPLIAEIDPAYSPLNEKFGKIASRYAVVQERLIAQDGSYPAIGRSIAYRCGAFHHLANEAWLKRLPAELSPSQVRCGLAAVITRTLRGKAIFDSNGWLTLGLSAHQPNLAEDYISTGSLYLCAAVFLPLGLSVHDEFWSSAAVPWTARKIWDGQDMRADGALKL
jgi:hypothetical protein